MRAIAHVAVVFLVSNALAACGGDAATTRADGAGGDASTSSDAGSTSHSDGAATATDSGAATSSDASTTADAGSAPPSCDASTCASLVGHLSRKPATKPQHGGIGNVYIAVFDGNPITDMNNAKLVARALLPNADLTSDSASIAYRVDGVPARANEYQVIAFLDDDHNASATSPAPSTGDLATIDIAGFSGVKVTVSHSGDTTLDLQLNAALP